METLKYRVIYDYEIHRGTSAAETAWKNLSCVWGSYCKIKQGTFLQFQCFRCGNFDLQNKSRRWPETQVNNKELKVTAETNLSQITSELSVVTKINESYDSITSCLHTNIAPSPHNLKGMTVYTQSAKPNIFIDCSIITWVQLPVLPSYTNKHASNR